MILPPCHPKFISGSQWKRGDPGSSPERVKGKGDPSKKQDKSTSNLQSCHNISHQEHQSGCFFFILVSIEK